MKNKLLLIFIIMLIQLSLNGFAQPSRNGSLKGKVVDIKSGEPLPGVNIIVMKTLLGASSDLQGNYYVSQIPVGTYQVRASMMGYKEQLVSVSISSAGEITQNFYLTETVIESPTVIITASKKAQSFQEVPNSVSLITMKDIQRRNRTYLNQVLEYTPGVYMMEGDVNIRGSSGFSLGAGSRVLLLVDGIPMMPGDSGDIKWDIVPLSQIERVEIVKGAGSALYGSHALGGVINIITKDPSSQPATSVNISGGIYDRPYYSDWEWTDNIRYLNQFDITHSRKFSKVGLLIASGTKESNGYQQNGEYHKYHVIGKINYQLDPQSTFTFQTNFTNLNYGEIFLWRNQNDIYQMPIPSIGDWLHSRQYSANAVFRQLINSKIAFKMRSSYFFNDWKHHYHDNDDYSKAQKLGFEVQADYLPNRTNTFTIGIEEIYDYTRSALFGHHYGYTIASYLQDELNIINKVIVTLGGRFDYHFVDAGVTDNQFNPKLGVNFKPSLLTTLRASLGRGFRSPTIAEMFTETFTAGFKVIKNPNLKAESAWSYEVGLNQILGEGCVFDLALFHNDYTNFIEPEPDIYQTVQFINVAKARIRGLEFAGQVCIYRRYLSSSFGYTYLDPVDLNTKETLAYRPRHLFTSGLTFLYSIFEAGVDYRYISRLEKVKVYPKDERVAQQVWDSRLSAKVAGATISFNINNLFQYNYLQIERNIAPMRHYVLSINYDF